MAVKIVLYAKDPVVASEVVEYALSHKCVLDSYAPVGSASDDHKASHSKTSPKTSPESSSEPKKVYDIMPVAFVRGTPCPFKKGTVREQAFLLARKLMRKPMRSKELIQLLIDNGMSVVHANSVVPVLLKVGVLEKKYD